MELAASVVRVIVVTNGVRTDLLLLLLPTLRLRASVGIGIGGGGGDAETKCNDAWWCTGLDDDDNDEMPMPACGGATIHRR